MSFWGNNRWIVANSTREIVTGFNPEFLKDGCYKLSIGGEAIVSSEPTSNEDSYKSLPASATLPLQPGQFAYLITEESITMPDGTIGFINVDTHTKIKGLINVSGFHVDPGYHGKLIFTVFNASPSSISLHAGQRIFRLWLSDFDGQGGQSKTHYDRLPRDLADRLHGTYPSPFALARRLDQIDTRLEELGLQRRQTLFALFLAVIFLLPFVASLYGSTFAAWFGNKVGESLDAATKAARPTQPAATLPQAPGASAPSTPTTPGASTPPPRQ